MPEIKAEYSSRFGKRVVTGRNLIERPVFDIVPPRNGIAATSMELAKFMDGINKIGRSAYSCAEAQALSKLLSLLLPPIDYSAIEFTRPTAEEGRELWTPCENCQEWLTKKTGGGSKLIYRLSDKVLELLSAEPSSVKPEKVELKLKDDKEFPPLG